MAMAGSGIRSGTNGPGIITGNNNGGGGGGGAATTGWSWPRMPWQRNETQRFRHPTNITPSSPDSQYGFSNNQQQMGMNGVMMGQGLTGGVGGGQPNCNGYSVIGSATYGVWGPPPPYSDPNSPARRGRYQYIQSPPMGGGQQVIHSTSATATSGMLSHDPSGVLVNVMDGGVQVRATQGGVSMAEYHNQHNQPTQQNHHHHQQCVGVGGGGPTDGPHSIELMYPHQQNHPTQGSCERRNFGKQSHPLPPVPPTHQPVMQQQQNKDDETTASINRSDTNSLPTRKTKKRTEAGAKSVGINQPTPRVNVQDVFNANSINNNNINSSINNNSNNVGDGTNNHNHQPQPQQPGIPRTTASGIELGSCQTKETESLLKNILEPPESEVYFGDVSSCCNVSMQQENLYDETHNGQPQSRPVAVVAEANEEDDYLAQRFGNREASVRSRMPFPQNSTTTATNTNTIDELTRAKLIPPMVQPRRSLLVNDNKESRQSMCSMDSDAEAKTEISYLSPSTPNVAMNLNEYQAQFDQRNGGGSDWHPEQNMATTNFVASFPYSSTDHSQEAVRRPTPKVVGDMYHQEVNTNFEQFERAEDCSSSNRL